MPTYEYMCPDGHAFELFQRMSDDPSADCPTCGKAAERQLSGGAGFLFKGSGFYITDYRSQDYKDQASKESGGAADTKDTASSPKSSSDTTSPPKDSSVKSSSADSSD